MNFCVQSYYFTDHNLLYDLEIPHLQSKNPNLGQSLSMYLFWDYCDITCAVKMIYDNVN